METKCLAIILYVNGLSFRAIANIVKVSHKTVYDWVRAFGLETYEKPKPQGEVVVEFDEMRHFLHSKKQETLVGISVLAANWRFY